MFKGKRLIFIIFVVVIFVLWVSVGYFSSQVELLSYQVLDSSHEYEIRKLDSHLIAETSVSGSFDDASGEAFGILAGYIFGDNRKRTSIAMTAPVVEDESEILAMTAPVIERESEVIAMTAPVVSEETNTRERVFSFVLPSEYSLDTLPEPNDARVRIREVNSQKVAVLVFSGFYSEEKISHKKEELAHLLGRDNISYSTMAWAGYNPPWTPPFMRRLEVWAYLPD